MGLVRGVLLLALLVAGSQVSGATYRLGGLAGLMLQPTSSYYHFVRGGDVLLGTEKEQFLFRLTYMERPPFGAAGFTDQEFFTLAQIGTKLSKGKNHGFYTFLGAGQAIMVLKPEDTLDNPELETRRHSLQGLAVGAEYNRIIGYFEMAFLHQLFIGQGTKEQTDAYVAWPYAFMLVKLGTSF